MVGYEEAREKALNHMSDKTFFNACQEHEHAWVFSKWDDMSIGGTGPCVVMKDTGETLNYLAAMDDIGNLITPYYMDENGNLTEMPMSVYDGDAER